MAYFIRATDTLVMPSAYVDTTSFNYVYATPSYNSFTIYYSVNNVVAPTANDVLESWQVWVYIYADNGEVARLAFTGNSGSHTWSGLQEGLNYRYAVRILRMINGVYEYESPASKFGQPVTTLAHVEPTYDFLVTALEATYEGQSYRFSGSIFGYTEPINFSHSEIAFEVSNNGTTWSTYYNLITTDSLATTTYPVARDGTKYYFRAKAKQYSTNGHDSVWKYSSIKGPYTPVVFDPPTGNWESYSSISVATRTVTSSSNETASGTGSYDFTVPTQRRLYRSESSNMAGQVYLGDFSSNTFTDNTSVGFITYYYRELLYFKLSYEGTTYPTVHSTYSPVVSSTITAGPRVVSGTASASAAYGVGADNANLSGSVTGITGYFAAATSRTRWARVSSAGTLIAYTTNWTGWTSGFPNNSTVSLSNYIPSGQTYYFALMYEVKTTVAGVESTAYTGQLNTLGTTASIPNYNKYSEARMTFVEVAPGASLRIDIAIDTPTPSSAYTSTLDYQVNLYRDNVLIKSFPRGASRSLTYTDNGVTPFTDHAYKTINVFRTIYLGSTKTNTDTVISNKQVTGDHVLTVSGCTATIDALSEYTITGKVTGYSGWASTVYDRLYTVYSYNSNGSGQAQVASGTYTTGTNITVKSSLANGVSKKFRIKFTGKDSTDNWLSTTWTGYSSLITGQPPIDGSAFVSIAKSLFDKDSVDLTGTSAGVTATAGYTGHTLYIQESTNNSTWTTIATSGSFSGSSGTLAYRSNKARGSTWYYRAAVKITSLVSGTTTTIWKYGNSTTVAFEVFDPPVGSWEATNAFSLSEDSSGITVTHTVPSIAAGSGSYDTMHTYAWQVLRRVNGTSPWTKLADIRDATADPGNAIVWLDTTAEDFVVYQYIIGYYFYLMYEGVRYGEHGSLGYNYYGTTQGYEVEARTSVPRTVTSSASSVFTANANTSLNGYATLSGNVSAITGAGTVTAIRTQWNKFAGAILVQSEGTQLNGTAFTQTHNITSALITPNITWTYKMYYEVDVLFYGTTYTYTGYADAGEVTGKVPHPFREMKATISSAVSSGTQVLLTYDVASLSPYRANESVTNHKHTIYYRVVGGSWSNTGVVGSYSSAQGRSNVQVTLFGLTPFADYEYYVSVYSTSLVSGATQYDTTIGPKAYGKQGGVVTFDISTPLPTTINALSEASVSATISNYSRPSDSLTKLTYSWTARDSSTNALVWSGTPVVINLPVFPLTAQSNVGPIPDGDGWYFAVNVEVVNSTLTQTDEQDSANSSTLTGVYIPPYGVEFSYPSITTTAAGLDISAFVTGITGPGYDSLSTKVFALHYRVLGSTSWTKLTEVVSGVFPVDLSTVVTGLVDTTVYEFYMSANVVGILITDPFTINVDDPLIAVVYNKPNTTGLYNDGIITSIGYNSVGSSIKFRMVAGIVGGTPGTDVVDAVLQRRILNAGNSWVDVGSVQTNLVGSVTYEFVDSTGTAAVLYDYRIKTINEKTSEVGDGQYNIYNFNDYTDHGSQEYLIPVAGLIVNDYVATVDGVFTILHSNTAPSGTLLRREWAFLGTTDYIQYSTVSTIPRQLYVQVRLVYSNASGSMPSNFDIIALEKFPNALTSLAALGRYSGNRVTWTGTTPECSVAIYRSGILLGTLPPGSNEEFLDTGAAIGVSFSYTVKQFLSDAGLNLYSPVGGNANAIRPAAPPLPAYPVIDCTAYLGRDNSSNPSMHLAANGTSLAELKSPVSTANSFFHSASPFVVVTDILSATSSLSTAIQGLLATRAFMCVLIDTNGAAHASDMIMSKSVYNSFGYTTSRNTFSSGFSFGSNTAYYAGGSSVLLPSWAQSIRFYFLNISSDGSYINPRDATNDILLSKNNLKVNGLGLDNAKLLCGIGTQTDGTVVTALNYHDDIIPFNGGTIMANTYSGPSEMAIQVLGSTASTGWDIKPNQGRIDRIDSAGNVKPWWNAGYGRSRMEFLTTSAYNTPKLTVNVSFPTPTLSAGFYSSVIATTSTQALNGGAEVLIPLPGAGHVSGDFYGIIVTPIGVDDVSEGVEESYGSGKGTLIWTNLSSSVRLAKYRKSITYKYDINKYEPEINHTSYSYELFGTMVGNNLRLSMSYSGSIEGRDIGLNRVLSVAPLKISIIKMR